jgi:hypothetical protein
VSVLLFILGLFAHLYALPDWIGSIPPSHPYWGYDFPLIGLAVTGFTVSYYYPTSRKGQIITILVISLLIVSLIGKCIDDILHPYRAYV